LKIEFFKWLRRKFFPVCQPFFENFLNYFTEKRAGYLFDTPLFFLAGLT